VSCAFRADEASFARGRVIDLYNFTPFDVTVVPARDPMDRDWWVAIVKGTFRIAPGRAAVVDEEQVPVATEDVFFGEPHASSLRMEDDLAPLKPRADVLVHAVARRDRPQRSWDVRFRVGPLDKTIRVHGPRAWVKTLLGRYELTDAQPCTEVPIRYEHAYGGIVRDHEGPPDVFEENPIGVGYVQLSRQKPDVVIAPQLEDPRDPIADISRTYRPQGLGPLTRSWQPRLAFAGTYDERWKEERWPNVPTDFDFSFYNCAHPDLIYPGYVSGGEEVLIEGIEERPLRFTLPIVENLRVRTLPAQMVSTAVIDTVHIDLIAQRVMLTWRARFRAGRRVDSVGVLMGEERLS
jgi:hypothetical protein